MQQAIEQEQQQYEWECVIYTLAAIWLATAVGNKKDEWHFYSVAKPFLEGI